jgi:hypothetical protein
MVPPQQPNARNRIRGSQRENCPRSRDSGHRIGGECRETHHPEWSIRWQARRKCAFAQPYASRDVSRRGNGTEIGHGPSGSAAPPRPRYAAIRGYGRGRPQPPACRRGCSGRLSSWMRSSMTDFRPSLERRRGSQRRRGRRERDGIGGCFGRAKEVPPQV